MPVKKTHMKTLMLNLAQERDDIELTVARNGVLLCQVTVLLTAVCLCRPLYLSMGGFVLILLALLTLLCGGLCWCSYRRYQVTGR